MRDAEFDFLTWKSLPSSIKLLNDEAGPLSFVNYDPEARILVSPGGVLKATVTAKQLNVMHSPSHLGIWGWNGESWRMLGFAELGPRGRHLPQGTFDWVPFTLYEGVPIPNDIYVIDAISNGGSGEKEAPGITWFDDLKIYQDDVLIYSNDFSNWDPVIGAGIGAPIGGAIGYFLKEPLGPMVSEVVGAVLGGALGGGVGLLTGLGIIPVPQIPALEAVPEGPGAPARLGKYQITG